MANYRYDRVPIFSRLLSSLFSTLTYHARNDLMIGNPDVFPDIYEEGL